MGVSLSVLGVPGAMGSGGALTYSTISGYAKDYDAGILTTLYQDSTFTTPVASNGDPVGGWKDATGSGDNPLQATTAAKPTYAASVAALNNQPALTFDGGDDLVLATFGGGALAQPLTIFCVAAPASVGVGTLRAFFSGKAADTIFAHSGFNYRLIAGVILQSGGGADPNPHIYTLDLATTGSKIYENGSLLASGNAGTNSFNGIVIGGDSAETAASLFSGTIARIIIYTGTLSVKNRNIVQNYLSVLYGQSVTEFA